jgi:hypothetical protein
LASAKATRDRASSSLVDAPPTARRTLPGNEAMAMIRNGQVQNNGGQEVQAQTAFVTSLFQIAA